MRRIYDWDILAVRYGLKMIKNERAHESIVPDMPGMEVMTERPDLQEEEARILSALVHNQWPVQCDGYYYARPGLWRRIRVAFKIFRMFVWGYKP